MVLLRSAKTLFAARHLPLLCLRGVVSVLQIGALFAALQSITLLETMLLRETAPLWVPLLSFLFLGERMPRSIWPMLLAGFAGVALVLHPKFSTLAPGDAYGLAVGLLFAIQTILTRRLNQAHVPQGRILFFIYMIGILVSAGPAAWTYTPIDIHIATYLGLSGLLMLASTVMLIMAFSFAPSWLLAPIGYSAVVFSALLDWLVFNTVPGLMSAVGMVVVVASGLMILRIGRRHQSTTSAGNLHQPETIEGDRT